MTGKDSNDSKIKVGLPLETMNKLPPNIIQTMLTLMPVRDAFRTSILSSYWRSHCRNIPALKFDDDVFQGSSFYNISINHKLFRVIYPILLLHQGPILEFSLCLSQLTSCCEIDQIILHLSRNSTTLNKFTLCIGVGDNHKLLPSFFTLQWLSHLKLKNCAFQPPATFKGFSKLISLYFDNVRITTKALLRFIINCPLLKNVTLKRRTVLANLYLFFEFYMKSLATCVIPHKLPTSLGHLKILHLSGLCFAREDELRLALLLVTSSPNIEKVKLEMYYDPRRAVSQTATNLLDLQDYSYVTLNHLWELEMTNVSNKKPEMDFVKLILTKSPMLKKVGIVIDTRVTLQDEVKMLKELVQYPRASTKAEIIFVRP